jgi:23S rRNA pseudouridine2457 synthase
LLFNKPYNVLSQFTREGKYLAIGDFGTFPKNVYPVGRLDADSEGLLLLTNDNTVNHRIADPKFEHPRTYWAQVEGIPTDDALEQLRCGMIIEKQKTKPAEVKLLEGEPDLPPRSVPIRVRKTIPTSWIELTLREGRNRQVRKMTAAVGYPTLRLVRTAILFLTLDGLNSGEHRLLTEEEISRLLTALQLLCT